MTTYTYKHCSPHSDRDAIIDMFDAVKDELHLPDRTTVVQMIDLVFERGGVFGAYTQEGQLAGALGYFYGDPANDFANEQMLFFYVAAILPVYRGTRLWIGCLAYVLHQMQNSRVSHIRMQAEATNAFTNKLYGRFASAIGRGKSLRGRDVITYEATLADAQAATARIARRIRTATSTKQRHAASFNPTPHHGLRSGHTHSYI